MQNPIIEEEDLEDLFADDQSNYIADFRPDSSEYECNEIFSESDIRQIENNLSCLKMYRQRESPRLPLYQDYSFNINEKPKELFAINLDKAPPQKKGLKCSGLRPQQPNLKTEYEQLRSSIYNEALEPMFSDIQPRVISYTRRKSRAEQTEKGKTAFPAPQKIFITSQ